MEQSSELPIYEDLWLRELANSQVRVHIETLSKEHSLNSIELATLFLFAKIHEISIFTNRLNTHPDKSYDEKNTVLNQITYIIEEGMGKAYIELLHSFNTKGADNAIVQYISYFDISTSSIMSHRIEIDSINRLTQNAIIIFSPLSVSIGLQRDGNAFSISQSLHFIRDQYNHFRVFNEQMDTLQNSIELYADQLSKRNK